MSLEINGKSLDISSLHSIARDGANIALSKDSRKKIIKCREMVERKISEGEVMYGINTGIGEFSETILEDDQIEDFQKYLIYNHAAGIGDAAPVDHVRAAMASRINVHANGNSGCRLEITETLIKMLIKGVTPFVCEKGSVGACGDLAPMAQIALVLLGEGKVFYKGELFESKDGMKKADIPCADSTASTASFMVSLPCRPSSVPK